MHRVRLAGGIGGVSIRVRIRLREKEAGLDEVGEGVAGLRV